VINLARDERELPKKYGRLEVPVTDARIYGGFQCCSRREKMIQ